MAKELRSFLHYCPEFSTLLFKNTETLNSDQNLYLLYSNREEVAAQGPLGRNSRLTWPSALRFTRESEAYRLLQ